MDITESVQQEIEADIASGQSALSPELPPWWISPEPVRSKTGFWEIPEGMPLPESVTLEWVQQHGKFHEAAAQKYILPAPRPVEMDEQRIRALIREEVHRALYPSAEMANPHEHMRVEMVTEQGKKWRGVLYGVEEDEQ